MSLKNKIPIIGIIGIGLTTVIGSGIWKDSLLWSNDVGILGMLTIAIGWLLFISAGLSYAECVSMFPKSGGPYSYVGGVFGKKAGSIAGISYLIGYLIIGTLLSFLAALFTLAAINPAIISTLNLTLLTLGYLLLFTILAAVSNPKILGYVSFGWVAVKIVMVIVIAIIALTNFTYTAPTNLQFTDYQTAINAGLWSLMGFEVMLIFSGDMDNVERKMPKAILIALPIILILSIFVSLASSGLISIGEILPEDSSSVSVIFLYAAKIGVPSSLIFGFAAFSAAGTGYTILATALKLMKVLSDDDVLPEAYKKEKAGINFVSVITLLIVTFIIGGIMVGTSGVWEYSVDAFAAGGLALILISALLPAGFIALYLRIKLPALTRPFKTPIFFIVFPLAIILSLYLLVLNFWDIAILWPGLIVFGVVLIFSLLFGLLTVGRTPKEETAVE